MALAVVQHTQYSSGSGTSRSATFTLATTPTVGNLLIAGVSFYTGVDPILTPTGWTLVDNNETDTTAGCVYFSRVVQAGDTTTFTLTNVTTGTDSMGGALYEITGQATTGTINAHVQAHNSTATTTAVTASATPTVVGTLAIAITSPDSGGTFTPTASSGWVVDEKAAPSFHSLVAAHRTALTSDTTTAITNTFSGLPSSVNVSTLLLIAPSGGAAPANTGQFFSFF